MKKMVLSFTTSTGGDATATGERAILSKLYAVEYRPAATSDATLTLTCTEYGAVAKPLLTKASSGASNVWYYPRDIPHAVADGSALTASAGGDRVCPILAGVPKLVVASGGSALSGSLILFFE